MACKFNIRENPPKMGMLQISRYITFDSINLGPIFVGSSLAGAPWSYLSSRVYYLILLWEICISDYHVNTLKRETGLVLLYILWFDWFGSDFYWKRRWCSHLTIIAYKCLTYRSSLGDLYAQFSWKDAEAGNSTIKWLFIQ